MMKLRYVLSAIISIAILLILIFTVNVAQTVSILGNAKIEYVLLALVLSMVNLAAKVFRWDVFLRVHKIKTKLLDVASSYLASLFLGNITPARVGELSRPYFFKRRYKKPFFRLLPIIIVERFLDILLILLFSLMFFLFFSFYVPTYMQVLLLITSLILVAFLVIIFNKTLLQKAFKFFFSFGPLKKFKTQSKKMLDNFIRGMSDLKYSNFTSVLLLTAISMLSEAGILFFSALSLGYQINPFVAIGFLSISLALGTISSLPGGLGSTEAILFALLLLIGLSAPLSLSITLLSRFLSYWVALIVSALFFVREIRT